MRSKPLASERVALPCRCQGRNELSSELRNLVLDDEILGPRCGVNIEALQRVALAVAQERNLESVMRMIVQGIAEAPEVALVRLWYVNPGAPEPQTHAQGECPARTGCLHLAASAGQPLASAEDWSRLNGAFSRFPFGVGKVGAIAQSGESVLIPDLSANQPWVLRPDWVLREGLRSFAGHPLKFRDDVLGVLGLFSRARLTEGDFRWLRTFADHAAVAIVNASALKSSSGCAPDSNGKTNTCKPRLKKRSRSETS